MLPSVQLWPSSVRLSVSVKSAMEAIGRQPEAADKIRTNMIIVAALIEGVALFAVAVCFMAL